MTLFDGTFGTGILVALMVLIVGFTKSEMARNPRTYHSYTACEGEPDLELYWD